MGAVVENSINSFEDALKATVDAAVSDSRHVAMAHTQLRADLAAGRFNTERALEVYSIAVDNATWEWLKDMPVNRRMYADYKASGLREITAEKFAEAFKRETGAVDQRPPRRFLRGLLGA